MRNLAMLLAVRNAARRREFSIRLALGGSRGRLARQLLTESAFLLLSGAACGLLFASLATRVLARWAELDISLQPDGRVILFTSGVTFAAGILFGLAPTFTVARIPIANALKTHGAASLRDPLRVSGGNFVMVLQIAMCLALFP